MHYEGSKDPAIALKELLEKYELSPLEINSCAADELIDFPLLSPVQCSQLIHYRSKHGALYSGKELLLIPSFCQELVDWMEPYVDYSTPTKEVNRQQWSKSITGSRWGVAEQKIPYLYSRYQSNKLDPALKLDFVAYGFPSVRRYNLLSDLQLKGGFIYRPAGRKNCSVVIGCLRASLGSNLIFRSHPIFFGGAIFERGAPKIGVDASLSSHIPLIGSAVTLNQNKWDIILGAGVRRYALREKLSVNDSLLFTIDPYRSADRLEAPFKLNQISIFSSARQDLGKIKLRYSNAFSSFSYPGVQANASSFSCFNQSLAFSYECRGHDLYLDLAHYKNHLALALQLEGDLKEVIRYRVQWFSIPNGYVAPNGQIGQSGILKRPMSQVSLNLDYQPANFHFLSYQFQQRFFYLPRYGHLGPSHDFRHQLTWRYTGLKNIDLQFRYRYKYLSEMAFRPGVSQRIHLFKCRLAYSISSKCLFWPEIQLLEEEGISKSRSCLLGSTIAWKSKAMTLKVQITAGKVEDYESRLYTYEQSLSYSFDQLVLYRDGGAAVVIAQIPVSKTCNLQLKYARYFSQDKLLQAWSTEDYLAVQFISKW